MQKFLDLRSGNELVSRASCVLCLGTFDGVHLGHRALIEETLRQKSLLSREYPDIIGGVWCFSQPPADFLFDKPTTHITSLDQKLGLFAEMGLDFAVIGDFASLCHISKDDFINNILIKDCRCLRTVCGYNFRFGNDALGTARDLDAIPLGNVTVGAVALPNGEVISSTDIRKLIASGELEKANRMLGRPYSLVLPVAHGKALGRKLGAPTANQIIKRGSLIPAHGVYATRAIVDGVSYPAITNIGTNPTVENGTEVKAETHILGFEGDLYGDRIEIEFMSYIRKEKKFADKAELAAAIASDIETVKKYFRI